MKRPSQSAPAPAGPTGADPPSLELFYRTHIDFVGRFVANRVNDPHTAADLVAEIFVRAIESSSTYKWGLGPPRAWLTGIARNVVHDHARKSARESAAYGRVQGRRLLDEESTERIVDRLAAHADARALMAQLAALPAGQRDVVALVAVDGLSLTDAAHALGISAGTARVRWHRARRSLRSSVPALVEVTS